MEENLIYILAFMGGLSLYIVTASTVGRALYSKMGNSLTEEGKMVFSVLGGMFFPIIIPALIIALWILTLASSPLQGKKEETAETNGNIKSVKAKPKIEEVQIKFKVGDLVTGVKGNPGNYKKLYQGCICRVLKVDSKYEDMEVKLVGHIDKEAHKEDIGMIRDVPWEYFTLIRPKRSVKKVAKKKVVKKKK